MPSRVPRPLVGITACLKERDETYFHSVQRKYVDAVVLAVDAIPLLLPAVGEHQDLDGVLDRLDGLMLSGSPSNVGAEHYGGPAPREDNVADPDRDATTLPLIRACLAQGTPLLAICRGIQELNVALGGSLHQHLHEVAGRMDHRSDKTKPRDERYDPRHQVRVISGGWLHGILGGAVAEIPVNSLHGQGLNRVADRLTIEAVAEDGTIEAVSVKDARSFALGVQWHPEYSPVDDPWSKRLFQAFGEAVRGHAAKRMTHAGLQRVA
jgi:putative glutamine amidotransferase